MDTHSQELCHTIEGEEKIKDKVEQIRSGRNSTYFYTINFKLTTSKNVCNGLKYTLKKQVEKREEILDEINF